MKTAMANRLPIRLRGASRNSITTSRAALASAESSVHSALTNSDNMSAANTHAGKIPPHVPKSWPSYSAPAKAACIPNRPNPMIHSVDIQKAWRKAVRVVARVEIKPRGVARVPCPAEEPFDAGPARGHHDRGQNDKAERGHQDQGVRGREPFE